MILKVKIDKKDRNPGKTNFKYPNGYDAEIISPFIYQNEGKTTEYCLAHAPDDFKTTKDMVEVTSVESNKIIDSWVDDDKDLKSYDGKTVEEVREEIKTKKKINV